MSYMNIVRKIIVCAVIILFSTHISRANIFAHLYVQGPALSVSVSLTEKAIIAGTSPIYEIIVRNSGSEDLTDIKVTTGFIYLCNNDKYTSLKVGNSFMYHCTGIPSTRSDIGTCPNPDVGDVVAEATYTTPSLSGTVYDSKSFESYCVTDLVVEKTSSSGELIPGSDPPTYVIDAASNFSLNYETIVRNDSTNPDDPNDPKFELKNIELRDPNVSNCDRMIASLIGTEQSLAACDIENPIFDNNRCFTNTIVAVVIYGGAEIISEPSTIKTCLADITIEITPDNQEVLGNGQEDFVGRADFMITVNNIGGVDLSNVIVEAPPASSCDIGLNLGTLLVGSSQPIMCSLENVTSALVNEVKVTADDPLGNHLTGATASAEVVVVHPHIAIIKSANLTQISSGDTVTYTYTVTNNGDRPLSDIDINDNIPPCSTLEFKGGDNGDGVLTTPEKWTYTCITPIINDTVNTATITGNYILQNQLQGNPTVSRSASAQASVNVVTLALSVKKRADFPIIPDDNPPVEVTFTITLSNPGEVPLSNITVTDDICSLPIFGGGDKNANNQLDTTETWLYTCKNSTITVDTTNQACATGSFDLVSDRGELIKTLSIESCDDEVVKVAHSCLIVYVNPPNQRGFEDDDEGHVFMADFAIQIINCGDAELTHVRINSSMSQCTFEDIGNLAPDEDQTHDCWVRIQAHPTEEYCYIQVSAEGIAIFDGTPPLTRSILNGNGSQYPIVRFNDFGNGTGSLCKIAPN